MENKKILGGDVWYLTPTHNLPPLIAGEDLESGDVIRVDVTAPDFTTGQLVFRVGVPKGYTMYGSSNTPKGDSNG